jgi:FMN phosphatase YigB (HAD superfamily)
LGGEVTLITTVLFDAGGTLVHVDLDFIHKELRRVGVTATLRVVREAECASKLAVDRRMQEAIADTDESRRKPYFAAMLDHLSIEKDLAARVLQIIEAEHQRNNLWRVMLPSTVQVLRTLRERGVT